MNQIRPIAICVFRHNDCILAARGYDPVKEEYFYRPLGGGIEFGEYSRETIRRELMEEIGAAVGELVYLGTLENVYVFNGIPGHEIVQVYDGVFQDPDFYDREIIPGHEVDIRESFQAVWKNLNEFREGRCILYPTGLAEMLTGRNRK